MTKKKIFFEGIVAILIILWIYTGISKLGEQFNFMYQLRQQVLFAGYAVFLSYAVPIVELIVAVLLVIPKTKLIGLWASLFLMTAFTIYVGVVLAVSKELPCQCGGIISTLTWRQHLMLNIVLTVISGIGIMLYKSMMKNSMKFQAVN